MHKTVEDSAKRILVMQRNLFLILSIFLTLSVFSLSIVVLKKESITFFKAPQTKLDLNSIEKQSHYLAHLILNRSGKTWEAQNSSLFEWVSPAFQIPLKAHLKKSQKSLIEEKKAFMWELKDSAIELTTPSRVTVFLSGELTAYIASHNENKQIIEKQTKQYLMEFTFSEGKPLLDTFHQNRGIDGT